MSIEIKIDWLGSANEIDDNLWNQCFPPHLEGKWWYLALEQSELNNQFKFAYALIKKDDQPVGIAPAFIMDVPIDLVVPEVLAKLLKIPGVLFPNLLYQRTLFVGSPCAEEGTVGLLPTVSLSEIAPHLQIAMEERAKQHNVPMIVWKDFAKQDMVALQNLSIKQGMFEFISYPGTIIDLPKGSIQDYFKSLKQSRRYNIQKKLKRSKKMGELTVEVIQHPSKIVQEEIFALFWQTYEKGKTKFERLNPLFFEHMAAQNCSYFVLLRQPDTKQLVAFMLCFLLNDRLINKFIGIDYTTMTGDWYAYFRLWEATVAWAMRLGVTSIQSGQTGYRAKTDVGHRLEPLTNYCKHRNFMINRIYKSVAPTISWATLDDDLAEFLKAHPEAGI